MHGHKWGRALALAVTVAGVFGMTATAQAQVIVAQLSASGSGVITGSAQGTPCIAIDKPNGTITPTCGQFISINPMGGATPIVLTAVPQASPPGHWKFVRWSLGPCTGSTAPSCVVAAGQPQVRAVFEDHVGPTVTLPADSGPGEGALQAVDTATFTFSANEAGELQCRLDAAEFAPCASPLTLSNLAPGAHRFDLRAVDISGNVGAIVSRAWSVAPRDNDLDGFNSLIDCNDADPAVRPGALEVNDNAIDENCDGVLGTTPASLPSPRSGPVEQVVVTLAFFANAKKASTKFTTLQIKNVPLGAEVKVTCTGKRCPKGLTGKGYVKKNAFGTVSLKQFIKSSLRSGNTITVVVSKPDAIAAVKVLKVRSNKKPLISTKCLPPGATTPVSC